MLSAQAAACAICRTTKPNGPGGKYFMVDHCHKSGAVRGLLCAHCNFVLGYALDEIPRLQAAIEYLRKAG